MKELNSILKSIKRQKQYGFTDLYAEEGQREGEWDVMGSMSPTRKAASAKKKKGADKGTTRDKPFEITWPKKKLADYKPIWLAPSEETDGEVFPQSELKKKKGAQLFRPTEREAVFDDDTIGVTPEWQTKAGKVFENAPYGGREDGRKKDFNKLLQKHGYDRKNGADGVTDADHVCELQVVGPDGDDFENLWPLNETENSSSGSKLSWTKVKVDDDNEKPIRHLEDGNYFFEIKDFVR